MTFSQSTVCALAILLYSGQKMVGKKDKVFLISLVAALLMVQSSTSSPIQDELLEALAIRLDDLQVKLNHLEAKNADSDAKMILLKAKDVEKNEKIALLEAKNAEQEEEISHLKAKIDAKLEPRHSPSSHNKELSSVYRKSNSSGDSSTRAAGPASCEDLSRIGHILDGYYLVQNPDTNQIETFYCTFGTSVSKEFVGSLDVKTKTVHFYVQRSGNFDITNVIIPWNVEKLNEGNAMDLASGIFTVPVDGLYHFEFSAGKDGAANTLEIILQVNGVDTGRTYVSNGSTTGVNNVVYLTASLRLKANDRVNLFNKAGVIYDFNGQYTHFTGWLVEEELK